MRCSQDFRDSTMARRGAQSSISRQKRGVQGLGKSEVGGIVGRNVVTEFPDTWQEQVMRVPV